jgi:hypothetical protein
VHSQVRVEGRLFRVRRSLKQRARVHSKRHVMERLGRSTADRLVPRIGRWVADRRSLALGADGGCRPGVPGPE